jgi:hypothetical protein
MLLLIILIFDCLPSKRWQAGKNQLNYSTFTSYYKLFLYNPMDKKNLLKELKKRYQEVGSNPAHKGIRERQELKNFVRRRAALELARIKYLEALNEEEKEESGEKREPLVITEKRTVKIELSTGWDADGFILEYSKEGELLGGRYYWSDWGVYEEVGLEYEEAEMVANHYGIFLY